MSKDYYKILGVSKKTPQEEIKKAYRKMAKEHHPDKGGDSDKFKDISEAYEVLSDTEKKSNYDNYGDPKGSSNPFGGGGGFGGGNPFEDFFSGGGFGGGSRRTNNIKRGGDLRVTINTDLLSNLKGYTKVIKINREKTCTPCKGVGGSGTSTCRVCSGNGFVVKTVNTIMGVMQQRYNCTNCDGDGHTISNKCGTCHGNKVVIESEDIELELPKGIFDGDLLRMKGKGNEYPNGLPGDLIIKVNMDSMGYEVDGIDIIDEVYINIIEAINGTTKEVNTINGKVKIDIKMGTQPHSTLRLRGKGLTDSRRMGDMLIGIIVEIPVNLTEQDKQIIDNMSQLECFKK